MSQRGLAFAVLCTGALMMILDGNIVTVALPSIRSDLGFGQSGLAWVVNAYLIPVAGLLLLAGRLGDLVGRKRVFVSGLSLFTVASLGCGLAADRTVLLVARFAQGVGGALASAVVLGLIVGLFPQARERARALAIFSFMGAAGASIGTIGGGVLTQLLSWHWIFLVNVPVGAVAVGLAVRVLAGDRGPGLVRGQPLVPVRIFASRSVAGANVVQILMVAAAMGGFQFLTTLYLRQVLGMSALATGIAFLPTPVVIGAVSLSVSARLTVRFGSKTVLLAGLVLVGAGLALLTGIPVREGYPFPVLLAMLVFGLGAGLALPANTGLAMTGVAPEDSGVAGGLINTSQQLGGVLGVAAFSAIAGTQAALTSGYRLAYAACVAVIVVALVVAAIVLPGKGKARVTSPEPAGIS